MRCLMHQGRTKRSSLWLAGLLVAGVAAAQTVSPSPLSVIPRTEAEASRIAAVTALTTDFSAPEPFEGLPAGAATVRAQTNADAFSQFSANISFERELEFKVGNGLFRKIWVSAPASTLASDGLGPLYNARACQSCHIKDGRGHPPTGPDEPAKSRLCARSFANTTAFW